MQRLLFFLFALVLFKPLYGQKTIRVVAHNQPQSFNLADHVPGDNAISDSTSVRSFTDQLILSLYTAGYLTASVDSQSVLEDKLYLHIHIGNTYQWIELNRGNVDEEALNKTGFSQKFFKDRPFNPKAYLKWSERLLNYYEDRGYPFAQLKLDSVEIKGNGITGSWDLVKHTFYKIDSIEINSDEDLPRTYILNYINVKKNDPYSERTIREVPTRLKEIPFVKIKIPHEVIFTEKTATLRVFLEKQKASSFNGVVGFLPDDETGDLLITGDVKLALQNALNAGEIIKLNWRKLQTNTQDLKAFVNYPFLFNTPLGGELDLKLYRRDTLFAEQNIKIGAQYALRKGNFFKVFLENYSSNLISTKPYEGVTTLPPYADVRKRSYGVGISTFKLNYKFNPRRGYRLDYDFSAGTKEILRNPNLNGEIYDSLALKTNQFNLGGEIEVYIPIFNRSAIKLANNSRLLVNENLFENELMRIGGFTTLRGFDEESIRASAYTIFTAEYRFLLEENSYFYVFTDAAYWEQNSIESYDRDVPIGFGTGISFETKAGIFTVNYALGSQRGNPVDLRAAKIHFGFVSLF